MGEPSLAPETEIDRRYRIIGRLGAGSMGVVYRAHDIALDRLVAVKLIEPLSAHDPRAARRFVNEARALAQVRHENVVQVYDYGYHEGAPYFVMEHIDGFGLDALIDEHAARGGSVEVGRAVAIIGALARGLDAVHARMLLHRDVKPSNVALETGTGRPVLIDFGLARGKATSLAALAIGGTPSYMAPEQARDTDGSLVTPAADLYALACTAFELLCSRPVFEGADIYEILAAHMSRSPPAIGAVRAELAPLDGVFARALAKLPEYRHPSCGAFASEIESALAAAGPATHIRARPRVSRPDAPRLLFFQTSAAFERQLVRTADRALATPLIECFTTEADLLAAFERAPADIIVLDEDAATRPLASIIDALARVRPIDSAQVIVLCRNWERGARAGGPHLCELPKPVNMQVFASVLSRAVAPRAVG